MILEVGKLNIGPIDSCSWGSGGKGKIADYVANKEPLDFAISHNSHNASHVTVFDDGSTYKFNCLPSSVSNPNVKVVIGADSALQVPKLLEEIKDWGLTEERLFIHPNAVVITEEHVRWEEENLGKIGSTMSGVGAARAAKLQRVGYKTVDQVPELSKFVCNTNKLVVEWLQHGKTGLLETAQGYDLSMDLVYDDADGRVNKFYPACTSRNINPTYFAGLSFIPHKLIGSVIMNLRTFGIRVGDNSTARGSKIVKFEDGSEISFSDSDFLSLESSDKTLYIGSSELSNGLLNSLGSVSYNGNVIRSVIELGSSGGCFPDQTELSWGELSEQLGIQIEEKTSLTKRVRRVFSFSNEQLKNSTMCCMPSHLSINFVNYLDRDIEGVSGNYKVSDLKNLWPKVYDFVKRVESEQYWSDKSHRAVVSLLGTGPKRRDMITLEQD